MKVYIKMRNTFLKISVIIFILSIISIVLLKNEIIGNLLLGIMASTIIISIQSHLSSQVEESKVLIDKLKVIRDSCVTMNALTSSSIDLYILDYEKRFIEYKNELNRLFQKKNELANIGDIRKKLKKELNPIIDKISDLELDLYFILSRFEIQSDKMKVLYYIEFFKIVKQFNFSEIGLEISRIGWKLDPVDFYKKEFSEKMNHEKEKLEHNTSIEIYDKTLEEKNKIDYEALKEKFERERYMTQMLYANDDKKKSNRKGLRK